ncbi:unnamed protein product, partial [Soboliphyme baturini]|uniref:PAS domain-containing protein n=1 Tax=Soboliphyme baturini TaxID=241478 RepID=A0A183J9X8_9BILA
ADKGGNIEEQDRAGNAEDITNQSTKGASKQRRSLINLEIEHLKELLPLSETTRNHIFQLQVMALVCTYIRKHHYSDCSTWRWHSTLLSHRWAGTFEKALREFLLVFDRQGKILYISGNVNEFLGHSVEELLCHGDSIYDLIDPKDHSSVQSVLWSGLPSTSITKPSVDDTTIICRL